MLIVTADQHTFVDAKATSKDIDARLEYNRSLPVQTATIDNWPVGPTVSAEAAILMEAGTGAVLYAKNIHEKEYPASMTKILTAVLVSENCSLDEIVTFSHDAVFDTPRNSNHIAIDEKEQLTVDECLQGLLVRSANEVAFALAEHVGGGNRQAFVDMMNERAAELGCTDTHFANPNGLPDENHYTSCYDMALIGRQFFDNELLCNYSLQRGIHFYPTEHQKDEIIETNITQILPGKKYGYDDLVGVKTGYTEVARSCLISCAKRGNMKLICVVMKDESPQQYEDTIALFDYGFSNFDTAVVSEAETKYNIGGSAISFGDTDIFGSSKPIISLSKSDYIVVPKTAEFSDLTSTISYETDDPGQVALVNYSYHGEYLGTASVIFLNSDTEGYEFDKDEEEEAPAKKGPKFVFINVVKIALILAALVFSYFALRVSYTLWKKYRETHPNWRREYRKDRRRRPEHTAKKKRKRPNRFRDYDY